METTAEHGPSGCQCGDERWTRAFVQPIESQLPEHALHLLGLGCSARRLSSVAFRRRGRWMRRGAPVDDTAPAGPQEPRADRCNATTARRRPDASGCRESRRPGSRRALQRRPQTSRGRRPSPPRSSPRRFDLVDAEAASAFGPGLFRIGPDDLEIRRGTKRDQRVACSFPRMLAARRGANAEQLLRRLDTQREVGRRVDEVIDVR